MEKFTSLFVFSLVSLVLVTSHANVTPEVYWNSMVRGSPMPNALKNIQYIEDKTILGHEDKKLYAQEGAKQFIFWNHAASENELKDKSSATLLFLKGDLQEGGKMNIVFNKNINSNAKLILSRKVADSIPFSSDKLPKIYQELSLDPNSMEANVIQDTISGCETPVVEGEEKYCATSLESMIDFSISKLGKQVMAISTDLGNTKETNSLQTYRIERVNELASDNAMVCHTQNYPYVVYYCHKMANTKAELVSLVNVIDGTKVKAVSVCHYDTLKWNPKHFAFQVLKVTPGTVVCHFLPEEHILWVPNSSKI